MRRGHKIPSLVTRLASRWEAEKDMGLNLTTPDTVIHSDPWWNPVAENQGTDRAYRIRQDQPVFVYKLITRGTVGEKILKLQAGKAALAAGMLEEALGTGGKLLWADLQSLWEPEAARRCASRTGRLDAR